MKIALMYMQGLLPPAALTELAENLRAGNIEFHALAMHHEPQASVQELVAPVMLCLSSVVGQSFLIDLAVDGTYDLLKLNILRIWGQLSGKFLPMRHAGGSTSNRPANMDLLVSIDDHSSLRIKLESDLPVEFQEACINKVLQLVQQIDIEKLRGQQIVVFDRHQGKLTMYSESEFIRTFLMNQSNK